VSQLPVKDNLYGRVMPIIQSLRSRHGIHYHNLQEGGGRLEAVFTNERNRVKIKFFIQRSSVMFQVGSEQARFPMNFGDTLIADIVDGAYGGKDLQAFVDESTALYRTDGVNPMGKKREINGFSFRAPPVAPKQDENASTFSDLINIPRPQPVSRPIVIKDDPEPPAEIKAWQNAAENRVQAVKENKSMESHITDISCAGIGEFGEASPEAPGAIEFAKKNNFFVTDFAITERLKLYKLKVPYRLVVIDNNHCEYIGLYGEKKVSFFIRQVFLPRFRGNHGLHRSYILRIEDHEARMHQDTLTFMLWEVSMGHHRKHDNLRAFIDDIYNHYIVKNSKYTTSSVPEWFPLLSSDSAEEKSVRRLQV